VNELAPYPCGSAGGRGDSYLRVSPHWQPFDSRTINSYYQAGVSGSGRLLDLDCGPGRVALPLSSRFSEVLVVDREPDMVEVGQQEARRLGIDNVRWEVRRAEELELVGDSKR
jgi:tRNA/tmRNA/rRNA uracil-C5-methylase (TrmA/RlmC/RlmD family)